MERRSIIAAKDCLNIPTLYWNDGDTTVSLGLRNEIAETRTPDFDGMLKTPDNVLILYDANMPEIMSMAVSSIETRIRIWINHPTEPDRVSIAVGD